MRVRCTEHPGHCGAAALQWPFFCAAFPVNSQPDCIQYQCLQILSVDCRKLKVGMDSCNVPGAIQYAKFIMPESLDTCEGARYSCYISADMRMMLCSFDQQRKYEVSLCEMNIMEAWNSKPFECFRNKMRNACPGCENGVLSSCEARFSQLGQKRTDRKISPFLLCNAGLQRF